MKIFLLIIALLFSSSVCAVDLQCENSAESETLVVCTVENLDTNSIEVDLNVTGHSIHPDYFYEIRFENSTLVEFPQTFFEQIEHLRTVKAAGSGIESIQGVFMSARHLRKLYLHQNRIKDLNEETFKGARDLGLLDLANNQIVSVGKGTFARLKYLSHVNLSSNMIDFIGLDFFKTNEILHTLDLSFNQLKSLELQVSQLTSVFASFNAIENFSMELLESEQNRQYYSRFLVKIFVDHNTLTNFKIDKRFKVRHLGLDHNQINDLSNLDARLPDQIEILDLSYNNLGALTKETFRNFYNLRTLTLQHSNLQFYDDYVFLNLVNLTELDISYNHFGELDSKLLSNLNSIELLKVDGNNLTRFDIDNLPQRVFAISLFDNDWDCVYLEELFNKLREHGKVSVPAVNLENANNGKSDVNGVDCILKATTMPAPHEESEHTTQIASEEE